VQQSPIAALTPLLLAVFILMAGNGMLTTLIALRGTAEGFSAEVLGLVGSSYFAGMLAGTWVTPYVVRRAGHIRAFAAYAATVGTAVLGFSLAVDAIAWMLLRCVIGFCFAGLLSIIESWVNDKASNTNRGRMLAVNNITNFCGSATGQQVLRLDDPSSDHLFSGAAAFFMMALVPISLTRAEPPPLPPKGRLDVVALYKESPIAVVGVVMVGFANGAFWTLSPVYVDNLALGPGSVSNFMTAVILGSALGPYPIGRISDKVDRRRVMIAIAVFAFCVEIALYLRFGPSPWPLYGLGFLVGMCLPVLYVLISAHTNDRVGRERMVMVSSTLLFLFCVGAICGPVVASVLMARLGNEALFLMAALVHLALAAFVFWRIRRRAAPTEKVEAAEAVAEVKRKPVVS
jgi:MFS family permease